MEGEYLIVLCLFLISLGFNIGAVYVKQSLYSGMNWGSIALSILTVGAFLVLFPNPENKKLYFGGVITFMLTLIALYGKKEWGKIKAIRFSVVGAQMVSLAVCLFGANLEIMGGVYEKDEYQDLLIRTERSDEVPDY